MEHKILYTADIHGNKKQLKVFLKHAKQIKPRTIIFGGDLAPKNSRIYLDSPKYIEVQEKFLKKDFPQLIKNFKKNSPETEIFTMLGNDDCRVNLDILGDYPELYKNIHKKRLSLGNNYDIVGYSTVPITPFVIKDFEKFDLSEIPEPIKKEYEQIKRNNYRLRGIVSVRKPLPGWKEFYFEPEKEKVDSIQKDLELKIFTQKPENTLYVFHSPPHNTCLDMISKTNHVGSFAIKEFIEKYHPRITLHGHIHETVSISERFLENNNSSFSMSPGNDPYEGKVSFIEFDLYKPLFSQRKQLSC